MMRKWYEVRYATEEEKEEIERRFQELKEEIDRTGYGESLPYPVPGRYRQWQFSKLKKWRIHREGWDMANERGADTIDDIFAYLRWYYAPLPKPGYDEWIKEQS